MRKHVLMVLVFTFVSAALWPLGNTRPISAVGIRLAGGVSDTATAPAPTMTPEGYYQVGPDQLNGMLDDKDFILLNVHVPYGGEIPQTDANIPFTAIEEISRIFPDKDERIVLYCRSGGMSNVASMALVQLGYTNITELEDGFNAWMRAGYKFTYAD